MCLMSEIPKLTSTNNLLNPFPTSQNGKKKLEKMDHNWMFVEMVHLELNSQQISLEATQFKYIDSE